MLTRSIALVTLAATLSLPGLARADQGGDAAIREQVRAMLTQQGYEVRKIEYEDGLYEAYALKDGKRMEIYVTAALEIVRGGSELTEKSDD